MVNIVTRCVEVWAEGGHAGGVVLVHEEERFGEDYDVLAWDIVLQVRMARCSGKGGGRDCERLNGWTGVDHRAHLLDKLPEDPFRVSVRVEIGGVEGVDPLVPCGLEDGKRLGFITKRLIKCWIRVNHGLLTSSSGRTQG